MKFTTRNKRFCWLLKEKKDGFKLILCIGNKEFPVRGFRALTVQDAREFLRSNVVTSYL